MSDSSSEGKKPVDKKAVRTFNQHVKVAWMTLLNQVRNDERNEGPGRGFGNLTICVSSDDVSTMRHNLAKVMDVPVDKVTDADLLSAVTEVLSDVLKTMRLKPIMEGRCMGFRHIL